MQPLMCRIKRLNFDGILMEFWLNEVDPVSKVVLRPTVPRRESGIEKQASTSRWKRQDSPPYFPIGKHPKLNNICLFAAKKK